VISQKVAAEMTTMLDEVVRVGTGTAANLDPYTVAGKTGTALVVTKTGYEAGHYVASFAGFVPAEKPSITAMVVVSDTADYGAAASAPTFATIARDALQRFNVAPQPKQPPAPGVPLATTASATGAGEKVGTPLPSISGLAPLTATAPTTVAPTTTVPAGAPAGATTSTTVPVTATLPSSGATGTATSTTAPADPARRPSTTTTSPSRPAASG
jgi:stage V sporulation protein D (sporulation-specific penicillin-binding protein)